MIINYSRRQMILDRQETNGPLAECEKWNVIFLVNSVPDKNGQVRYQRILGMAGMFNVFVVTRAPLPVELFDLVEEVRVASSRKEMLREAIALSKSFAAENRKFYIHSQYLPFTGLVGYVCKKLTGCKWVYDLWDHPSLKWAHIRGPMRWWRQGIWSVFRRLILPGSDAWIIAMHPGILGQLPAAPVSCRLIFSNPGYIPEENDDPVDAAAGEESEVSIVYAGLIKSNRGFDLMSDWAAAYTGAQKVRLHLIGRCSEPARFVLNEIVENSQDRANFSLQVHGEIPHSDVLEILSRSNIGLCPINPDVLNYRYAFPVKIIEYLGAGLIVVATRAHGICAMVSENETGYTFEYDLQSFSMAMEKAIADCTNEASGNRKLAGSNQLVENYQWHLVNERLTKDILQIL